MTNSHLDTATVESEISQTLPVFARHETFHPRYGWLKKGFDAVCKDPAVFHSEDAPVTLGVGKNMVRAIRYWCLAFKVLEEAHQPKGSRGCLQPSEFGTALLSDRHGWDPFMEQTATLWLLHWKLFAASCQATAWYYAFNYFHRTEFTVSDLCSGLTSFVAATFPKFRLAQSSVKKDAACIIRMYVESKDSSNVKEDTIDCPFAELGLIVEGSNKNYVRFAVGEKVSLPAEIVASCCLEYASSISSEARTISLSTLLYSAGSPGLLFKMNEQSLYQALETVASKAAFLDLSDTAGMIQLSFDGPADSISKHILQSYYEGDSL